MSEDAEQLARLKAALAERYSVERKLGHGGMATVWLAQDLKHDRPVALKVLRPELAAALGPERFLREVRITARLNHPHILPLLDSGEADSFVYYAMPYVEGESLRERLNREKQLPLDDALQTAREVADALSYAHSHDVVHRDIKPENILLESGHAVVADFGIARAITAAGGERLTQTGIAMGTPVYMSPEQAAGSTDVDGRSDLYSLGCVLYEMLAGHPPFMGTTAQEVLARHSMDAVPRLRAARPAVPNSVEEAVQTALAKVPADRFATAGQFATALEAASVRSTFRRRRFFIAAMAVLVVAASVVVSLLRPERSAGTLDPDLIAVMPFRATGAAPALHALAEQIPDIFWTKITGDFGPHVTDPSTVAAAWHRAGGAPDVGLPEREELQIARGQGAGRLVRGVIGGSAGRITITASLLDVSDKTVRVPPTVVEGPSDRWIPLLDSLVVLLIVKDFGVKAQSITELARYSPQAIQAYLAGLAAQNRGDFDQAQALYTQALDADSTFAQAAFHKWDAGETDTVAARLAWRRQDQLNALARAQLRAQVSWFFGSTRTEAEVIAQWDSVTTRWPKYRPGWVELGEELVSFGSLVNEPGWLARSRDAWERVIPPKGRVSWIALMYGAEAAAQDGDLEVLRQYLSRWALLDRDPLNYLPQFEWRLATLEGDSARSAHVFPTRAAHEPGPVDPWYLIPRFALVDGRGTKDADRAAALTDSLPVKVVWMRNRGRHREWMRWRDGPVSPWHDEMTAAVIRVRDALFLGEERDSAVEAAVEFIDRAAGPDGTRSVSPDHRAIARCWSTLWRVGHGDTRGARATARYLREEVALPYHLPVCAGLIDVMLQDVEGGALRVVVERLDSTVRPVPLPVAPTFGRGYLKRDGTLGLDNLVLARWLLRVGDTSAALAASRRRISPGVGGGRAPPLAVSLLVDALREEGRLAAMTGDTAGAIRAYNHYLALREDPDYEPWRRERDQVRRELTALIGERRR